MLVTPKFRGHLPGSSFITSKGFRGMQIDTCWSQLLLQSFEKDDAELAATSLKSDLADVKDKVEGGEHGAPFSIGDFGFYANNQFTEAISQSKSAHRTLIKDSLYLPASEWKDVDEALEKGIRHHGSIRFAKVVRGDTFAALAVR